MFLLCLPFIVYCLQQHYSSYLVHNLLESFNSHGAVFMVCIGAGVTFIGCFVFLFVGAVFIQFVVTIIIVVVVLHSGCDVMCIDIIIVEL